MKYLELVLSNTHHPPNFALDKFNKTHYYSSWKSILVCTVLKPVQAGFVFSILDIVFSESINFLSPIRKFCSVSHILSQENWQK